MGLIRWGDPYRFPEIDTIVVRNLLLHRDSVWRHKTEAEDRQEQLENKGKNVYIYQRSAPPEEVKSHLPTRGIPELGEEPVHLDGRYTGVWDVWVVQQRSRRRKKNKIKSKSKRKIKYK